MQEFTAARVKCINGQVGNFYSYGVNEEQLKEMLERAVSRTQQTSEQSRAAVESLLVEKMQAVLLHVDLKGRHTSESLGKQIEDNLGRLEGELLTLASAVAARTADVKEYVAAQTRALSTEAAKAVVRLNDIQGALEVIRVGQLQNAAAIRATLQRGEMTYAQVMSIGGTLEMIREEIRQGNERLQQEMRRTHSDVDRIESLLSECLRKVEQRIVPVLEKSEAADYDRLTYERETARSTVREQVDVLSLQV